jgi:hypothetical protein
MPGSPNPVSLSSAGAKGRNLDRTVPESALDFEISEVLLASVNAHISDPIDAHDASAISVADAEDRFESTEVEGVITEVGGALEDVMSSGVISAGTFTSAGLLVTFDASSVAVINGAQFDFSGETITLPDNSTRYVYYDTARTLQHAGNAPNLAIGELALWRITTLAGVVTTSTDLRFFTRQASRKPHYTVRASGTNNNKHAEGNFESIEAAMAYIDIYANVESEKFTVLVRGDVTISATVQLPRSNITFEGEGGNATITTGASLDPMFDLNGRQGITFRNLVFRCAHANSTAIADVAGSAHDCLITKCSFSNGGTDWENGVTIEPTVPAAADRFTIEKCSISCTGVGVSFSRPNMCRVVDTYITDAGSSSASIGISIGTAAATMVAAQGLSVVRGCTIIGFGTGIFHKAHNSKVEGCVIRDTEYGIELDGGNRASISDTVIALDATNGMHGILINGGSGHIVTGCQIVTARVVFGLTDNPHGIRVGADTVQITNNIIDGFNNTGNALGYGIGFDTGTPGSGVQTVIAHNTVTACNTAIGAADAAAVTDVKVDNCRIYDAELTSISFSNTSRLQISNNRIELGGTNSGIEVADTTDFQVVDNYIDGNAGNLNDGILISGADAVGDRTRKFVVSGNVILGVGSGIGIQLSGYVQNGTISGNTIDGYLAATPFDPTSNAGIGLINGTGGDVIAAIVVTGNQIQRCRNGIIATATNDAPITEVSITANAIHHCGFAQVGTGADSFAGAGGKGIGVEHIRGCLISDNTVRKIGRLINEASVEAFPSADGPDVKSMGIYARNCSRLTISDNRTEDIMSLNLGSGNGIYVDQRTSGVAAAATFTSRDIKICGNQTHWSTGLAGNGPGSSGVVVTCTLGSDDPTSSHVMRPVSINDNQIRNTLFCGIAVSIGDRSTLRGITVNGNNIEECATEGVLVLLYEPGASLGASVLDDINIAANTIVSTTTDGVSVKAAQDTSISRVRVSDNFLRNIGSAGIYFEVGDGVEGQNFQICDNEIITVGAEGVAVNALAATFITGIQVNGNQIIDATNEGITIFTEDVDLSGVTVNGNVIQGPAGSPTGGKGIFITTTESGGGDPFHISRLNVSNNQIWTDTSRGVEINTVGAVQQAVISDNLIEVNGTASPLYIINQPVGPIALETYTEMVSITGNTFKGGGSAVQLLTFGGLKLRDFTHANNIHRGGTVNGFIIDVSDGTVGTGDAVYNLAVTGNTFDNIAEDGVRILLGGAVISIDNCHHIVIANNRFTSCGTSGNNCVIFLRTFALLHNLTIDGNVFKSCGVTDGIGSGIIQVELGSDGATNAAENIQITRNSLNACTGVGIFVQDHSSATNWTLVNLKVDGNTIQENTNDAIRLDLAAFTVARNISVSDNYIDNVASGAAASDAGIVVLGPDTANLAQLTIRGNSLRTVGASTTAAIRVDSADDMEHISIDNNKISTSSATTGAIHVQVDGQWVSGSVCGNTIHNPTGVGIFLDPVAADAAPTGMVNVRVDGNQIYSAASHGIHINASDNTSTPTLEVLSVSDNLVEDPGGSGIRIEVFTSSQLMASKISDNVVRSATDEGIVIGFSGSGTVIDDVAISGNNVTGCATGIEVGSLTSGATISSLRISENIVSDIDGHAIIVFGTILAIPTSPFVGVSIVGNLIKNFSGDAGGTDYSGISMIGEAASHITVANNVIVSDAADAIGYHFQLIGQIRSFAMTGNTSHLGDEANTESMRFDTGVGADQASMTFTGNTFRAAVTGVNFNASSFTPDRSILVGNTDRTTGGAGNLTAFGAVFTNSQVANNQD